MTLKLALLVQCYVGQIFSSIVALQKKNTAVLIQKNFRSLYKFIKGSIDPPTDPIKNFVTDPPTDPETKFRSGSVDQ